MGFCQCLFQYLLIFLICYTHSVDSQYTNISTKWINNNLSSYRTEKFDDGSMVRFIINAPVHTPHVSLAFYCNGHCTSFLLGIFLHYHQHDAGLAPHLIWSANRNNPVRENSTLEFIQEGDLILRDVDGTSVWSTNTTGRSVVRLEVNVTGNLVLFDANNKTIWQSFDHPTDTLVLGQILPAGQRLIASESLTNMNEGLHYVSVTNEGLFAFINSSPPLSYFEKKTSTKIDYVKFLPGNLSFYANNPDSDKPVMEISVLPVPSNLQYVKLDSDGHLKVYAWVNSKWDPVDDIFSYNITDRCHYPLVCGKYGICLNNQCTSPDHTYFQPLLANIGYAEITPLSCEIPQKHRLLSLDNITNFNFGNNSIYTDIESCKQACLKNCSCKVSFFKHRCSNSKGDCYLESEVFSLINNENLFKSNSTSWSFHIKVVANSSESSPTGHSKANIVKDIGKDILILVSVLGTVFAVLITMAIIHVVLAKKKKKAVEKYESCLDLLSGSTPMRFSYEELKTATENFCRKLGEGASGSVYEGTLINGNKVAVKWLDGYKHAKIPFVAEVETIGSIHHVNLVKLIGFCADKSHKLLVYEFMCNGSLDKWIFSRKIEEILDWQTRQKIILDIAKGLAYLHEECRQRILHLDIKPQNILLDDKFNAKVADFGLSKLVDKDQSKIMTAMRGTPGYMAPEWVSFVITEKADVYSFGIVLLEVLVGQKNLDFTKPDKCIHLLALLEKNTEDGELYNLIDSKCDDMKLHAEEVMKMMKLVVWCVQSDFCRRPSMSVVVKVLDGVMDIEPNLDYKLLPYSVPIVYNKVGLIIESSPLLPSVLSGPR